MAQLIKIDESSTHDKGLFTTQAVHAGDELFSRSQMFLAVLSNNHLADTCSYCFQETGHDYFGRNIENRMCTGCQRLAFCGKVRVRPAPKVILPPLVYSHLGMPNLSVEKMAQI
jgi:hypothetical protein